MLLFKNLNDLSLTGLGRFAYIYRHLYLKKDHVLVLTRPRRLQVCGKGLLRFQYQPDKNRLLLNDSAPDAFQALQTFNYVLYQILMPIQYTHQSCICSDCNWYSTRSHFNTNKVCPVCNSTLLTVRCQEEILNILKHKEKIK